MAAGQYILVDHDILDKLRQDIADLRQLLLDVVGNTNGDTEEPMDTADLMKYLKLDRRTIYNYRKKKGMPYENKDNGRIYYWKSAIDAYFGKK